MGGSYNWPTRHTLVSSHTNSSYVCRLLSPSFSGGDILNAFVCPSIMLPPPKLLDGAGFPLHFETGGKSALFCYFCTPNL